MKTTGWLREGDCVRVLATEITPHSITICPAHLPPRHLYTSHPLPYSHLPLTQYMNNSVSCLKFGGISNPLVHPQAYVLHDKLKYIVVIANFTVALLKSITLFIKFRTYNTEIIITKQYSFLWNIIWLIGHVTCVTYWHSIKFCHYCLETFL